MNQLNNFTPAVTGVFGRQQRISRILADLRENDFQQDDVALVCSKEDKELTGITHLNYIPQSIERGIVASAVMGGVFGLVLGFGMNSFPGDIFTPAGPILSAIAGVGFGITVGFFVGLIIGFMENRKVRQGVIVAVHVNNRREEILARNVLLKDGALEVISSKTHYLH